MEPLIIMIFVVFGTLLGGLLCMIPSLHIYNVAGISLVIWLNLRNAIPYYAIAPFFMSMIVAYSFINTI
ncbi:MAG TPA: hypothetical protein PLJ38_09150, partial [bacterium]|nr:hypothetical protein [bacterium]